MANGSTISGTASSGGLYSWYARVNVSLSSETSTTATYSCTLGYYTRYAISVNANGALSGMASGSWSGKVSATSQSGTTVTVLTKSVTITKTSSTQTKTLSGYIQITGGFGNGTSSASVSVTVPAITYSTPNAPSSCSATRNSDSKATVTWTNGSTSTTRPRSRTYVYRMTDDGSYSQLGYVGSSTATYTDSSISSNHRYRYRVRAYGSGGYSSYATSDYIYTTPAAPSSVTISRVEGTTQVSVDAVVSNATYATSWTVQYSLNGGDWTGDTSVTSFPVTIDPGEGGTMQVRVCSVRSSLVSSYTTSSTITTICAPYAPSVTLGTGASVQVAGNEIAVTWVPNHIDGTSQTKAQVEYTVDSEEAVTEDITGSTTTFALPESVWANPCSIKARVRTYGEYEEWGEWSSYVSAILYDLPTASITSPDNDEYILEELPLEIAWDASDVTGISSQTLVLISDDGSTLWSSTLSGDERSYSFTNTQYQLQNFTTYTLRLTVSAGSALSVTTERVFTVDWLEPVTPRAEYGIMSDSLAVELTVYNGEDEENEGLPNAASFSVYRVYDGETWELGTDIIEGDAVQDPLPPLNVDYSYLVVGVSESGTTSTLTIDMTVDSEGMEALNFGQGASEVLLLGLNTSGSVGVDHSGTLYSFATGSDSLPVYYPTGELEGSISRSYSTTDMGIYRNLLNLGRTYSECWLRDFDGGRHFGQVSISGSLVQGNKTARSVDVDMEECVFEEAW